MSKALIIEELSMKKPKVSVCLITYNHEKYIRQCMQSLVDQQTSFDYEIIVGDDASTDGSRAIIREFALRYPDLVKVLSHEENVGPSQNYRDVHFQARGEYLAHIDGDDYWMPWKLQLQADFLDAHQECVAVYCNALVLTDDHKFLGVFNDHIPEVFDLGFLLAEGNFLNNSSLCYRSRYRERVVPHAHFLDYLVHLRLGCSGKLGYLNKVLVVYRVGSETSILVQMTDKCRLLSWETLQAAQHMPVSKAVQRNAVSLFIFDVLHEGLRRFDMPFLRHWMHRIYRESGAVRNSAMFVGMLRVCASIVTAPPRRMRRFVFGPTAFRVLHSR